MSFTTIEGDGRRGPMKATHRSSADIVARANGPGPSVSRRKSPRTVVVSVFTGSAQMLARFVTSAKTICPSAVA